MRNHDAAIVEIILRNGLKHGSSRPGLDWARSPNLHVAALWNRVEEQAVLLAQGAAVNDPAKGGYTPAHIAAHFGNAAALEVGGLRSSSPPPPLGPRAAWPAARFGCAARRARDRSACISGAEAGMRSLGLTGAAGGGRRPQAAQRVALHAVALRGHAPRAWLRGGAAQDRETYGQHIARLLWRPSRQAERLRQRAARCRGCRQTRSCSGSSWEQAQAGGWAAWRVGCDGGLACLLLEASLTSLPAPRHRRMS